VQLTHTEKDIVVQKRKAKLILVFAPEKIRAFVFCPTIISVVSL
jgi:hypothetical protein